MELTPDRLSDLSCKVENFIELELGTRLPYVSVLIGAGGQLYLFTNRRSNAELQAILQASLEAVEKSGDRFISLDGEIIK